MTDPTNYHNDGDDWPTVWDRYTPPPAGELFDAIADLVTTRRQPWRQHAACRGVGPALFYVEHRDMLTAQTAKAICAACPVIDDCRQFAIESGERSGIWGGGSADTYRRERWAADPTRQRSFQTAKPIDHGTERGYRMHIRRGIPVCDDCRDGRNAERAAKRAEGRAA